MEKKNVLKSSHLFHFRFDVARRFAWNDIEFPGESFELALLLLPIKGMISGAWTRAAHSILFFSLSLSFLKLLVSTRREGWGIYSRRGVFFTLPATSARIDQLFIGRESGSTSLEEKERASWHEWIKGNSSGNYADFSIFFSPPLDLDCPSTGFVASFFSSLPR